MRVVSKVSQSIHKKYLLYTSCRFIVLAFILSLDSKPHFPLDLFTVEFEMYNGLSNCTAGSLITRDIHVYHISTYHMNAKSFHVNAFSNLFTD